MESNSVAIAAITLAGTIAAGFFTLINKQNKTHTKIADGLNRLAKAHEKGNKEAEQRNGHLADLVVKTNKRTIEAVQVVHKQKVEHQDVHEATLNKTRFKNE